MSHNYRIERKEPIIASGDVDKRLARISQLVPHSEKLEGKDLGRNVLTRTIDKLLALVRKNVPPLHWLAATITSTILFLYVRSVALTSRLITTGSREWPDVPIPSVLALWHRDAPTLLIAFAKRRPQARMVIMISRDPRGDALALLCQMIGLEVVRGNSHERGWNALSHLARELINGACVIVTADGGGPARIAKVGAVALASSVGVPLVPLAADCRPAIEERHKWDAARNPLPLGNLLVLIGLARRFEPFEDLSSIEEARRWLEATLTQTSLGAAAALKSL